MLDKIVSLGISKREAEELIRVSRDINSDFELLKKGYPIQYLIGYVNFYNYTIKVNDNVLIPRFETETLVEKTIKYLNKYNIKNPKVLDLCTGSGCIAIALSKELNCSKVIATDISDSALLIAKENARMNQVKIEFQKSDMFKDVRKEKFDLIISNPPYVPIEVNLSDIVNYEPINAIKAENNGSQHILEIINEFDKYTSDKAIIAIEICEDNLSTIKPFLKNLNYKIEKDLADRVRYLFIFKNVK